jgi:hypothetical protein
METHVSNQSSTGGIKKPDGGQKKKKLGTLFEK